MELIIINIVESISMAWFLSSLIECRKNKILYGFILSLFNFIVITASNYIQMYDILLTTILMVMNTFICYFFTKDNIFKIIFIVCFETVYLIFISIISILLNSFNAQFNIPITARILYIVIGYFLLRYFQSKKIQFDSHLYFILTLIMFGLHFALQNFIQIYINFANQNYYLLTTFFIFMLSIIFLLFLIVKIVELYNVQTSYKRLQETRENEKIMSKLYDEVKIVKHDLKHDFQLINHYLKNKDYDQLQELIKHKQDLITDIPILINSPNELINVILNNKIIHCYTKNIQMNSELFVNKKIPIHELDLCELLSNLLDNAIENSPENSQIIVKLKQDDLFFHIYIENKRSYEMNREKEKDKKNHGFGLKSVKRIVDKYNGQIEIQKDTNEFIVCVNLLIGKD